MNMKNLAYPTEQLTQSTGRFNKLVLTYRPNIYNGDYCKATISDSDICDKYNSLRNHEANYDDLAELESDLQDVIDYVLNNGIFYNEEGEEIDEYDFMESDNNDLEWSL